MNKHWSYLGLGKADSRWDVTSVCLYHGPGWSHSRVSTDRRTTCRTNAIYAIYQIMIPGCVIWTKILIYRSRGLQECVDKTSSFHLNYFIRLEMDLKNTHTHWRSDKSWHTSASNLSLKRWHIRNTVNAVLV